MTAQANQHALHIRDVCKRFGNTEIIRHLHLAVRAGERVALIGPNGAGKSTLLDLISGRIALSSGEISLRGQRIDGKAPFEINRMGLSRSFQVANLFGQLSVFENLRCAALWSLGYGYTFLKFLGSATDATERTEELMARLGLANKRDVAAAHLTHAEQRALEIGMTLAGGAGVILLDEPTSGMAKGDMAHFVELVRRVTTGKTLLMVEHDMGVVFDLADRVAVLVQGELLAFDTPAAIRDHPEVQRAYLGTAASLHGHQGGPG